MKNSEIKNIKSEIQHINILIKRCEEYDLPHHIPSLKRERKKLKQKYQKEKRDSFDDDFYDDISLETEEEVPLEPCECVGT